jgi:hypothetical protein
MILYQRMQHEELKIDPEQLRAEAEKEPPRRGLSQYAEAIALLKQEKGFSFREIAAWLRERGLKVDHNAVWRAYSKTISAGAGREYIERIERSEREAAHGGALPWLNEP